MLTEPPQIEDFLEACRMWPWADEDILHMHNGDTYVFGMAFIKQVHNERGVEHCYSQAWLEREPTCWRYKAFSTLQQNRVRAPINTSGTFTLDADGIMHLDLPPGERASAVLSDFVRACRHLHLLKKRLTDDQKNFFMRHGFHALMRGLWLDKNQRTRKKLLAIDENGEPCACYYDFGDEPLLIQECEINRSIKDRSGVGDK